MKRFLRKVKRKLHHDQGRTTGHKESGEPGCSNGMSASTQSSSGPSGGRTTALKGSPQGGPSVDYVVGGPSPKPTSREELRACQARAATERREQDRLRGNLSEKVAQRLETVETGDKSRTFKSAEVDQYRSMLT